MSDDLACQDELREELIGGELVMMAPASSGHTYTAEELAEMTDEEKAVVVTQFKCHLYDDLIFRLEDIFGDMF